MVGEELGDDIAAEDKADTPLIFTPARHALFGVGPQQVAEQPLVWNLNWPNDLENLFEVLQLGAEAAVHAEDLLVDQGAHWHHVEDVREYFPQLQVVFPFA